jgi:hypothetical protein
VHPPGQHSATHPLAAIPDGHGRITLWAESRPLPTCGPIPYVEIGGVRRDSAWNRYVSYDVPAGVHQVEVRPRWGALVKKMLEVSVPPGQEIRLYYRGPGSFLNGHKLELIGS